MKPAFSVRSLVVLAAVTSLGNAALAGPMTPPPGAPKATMKTLAEVEPRVAINATNTPGDADSVYRITQPGSYYLTGDLTGAPGKYTIQVEADGVTIDLNGYTMRASGSNTFAFGDHGSEELPRVNALTITNGVIDGHRYGVLAERISGLTVRDVKFMNGYTGVSLAGSAIVEGCTFMSMTGTGVTLDGNAALVRDSIFTACDVGVFVSDAVVESCVVSGGRIGLLLTRSTARDCHVHDMSEAGIQLNTDSRALDCMVVSGQDGIVTIGMRTEIRGCTVERASGDGIQVGGARTRVVDNTVRNAGGTGIRVLAGVTKGHIEGNDGMGNLNGVSVLGSDFTVIRNTFGANSNALNATFYFAPGNRFGTIVKAGTNAAGVGTSAASATVSGTFSAGDPFANLSF